MDIKLREYSTFDFSDDAVNEPNEPFLFHKFYSMSKTHFKRYRHHSPPTPFIEKIDVTLPLLQCRGAFTENSSIMLGCTNSSFKMTMSELQHWADIAPYF